MHYQICRPENIDSREFHLPLRKIFGKLFLSNHFQKKISTKFKVKICYLLIETLEHVQQSYPCVSAPLHTYVLQVPQILFHGKLSIHCRPLLYICLDIHDDLLHNIQSYIKSNFVESLHMYFK